MSGNEEQNKGELNGEVPDPTKPAGKNYLFIIGINNYQDQPNIPRLNNAVFDARKFSEILLEKYQFDREHCIEIYDEQATQGNILAKFRELAGKITDQDSLVIYFSGHGEYDAQIDKGFWLPVDARRENIGSFITFDLLLGYLKAIKSFHTFLIADSCYAGTMFLDRDLPRSLPDRLERIPSRWLLTAGRNEVVTDGPPGQHSPFANALIFHLSHNDDPDLTISELSQLVLEEVVANARQTPRCEPIHGVGHRGGEFVFRPKGAPMVTPALLPREDQKAPPPETPGQPPTTVVADPDSFASLAAVRKALQSHLLADDIDRLFQLFDKVIDPDSSLSNDLILQQSRYNGLKRDLGRGVVSQEQATITHNRIRVALIEYIKGLEERDLSPAAVKK